MKLKELLQSFTNYLKYKREAKKKVKSIDYYFSYINEFENLLCDAYYGTASSKRFFKNNTLHLSKLNEANSHINHLRDLLQVTLLSTTRDYLLKIKEAYNDSDLKLVYQIYDKWVEVTKEQCKTYGFIIPKIYEENNSDKDSKEK